MKRTVRVAELELHRYTGDEGVSLSVGLAWSGNGKTFHYNMELTVPGQSGWREVPGLDLASMAGKNLGLQFTAKGRAFNAVKLTLDKPMVVELEYDRDEIGRVVIREGSLIFRPAPHVKTIEPPAGLMALFEAESEDESEDEA